MDRPSAAGELARLDGAALARRVGDLLKSGEFWKIHESFLVFEIIRDLTSVVLVNPNKASPEAVKAAAKRLSDFVVGLKPGELDDLRGGFDDESNDEVRAALLSQGTNEAKAAWTPRHYSSADPHHVDGALGRNVDKMMERGESRRLRSLADRLAFTRDLDRSELQHRANHLSGLVLRLDRAGKLEAFKKTISDSAQGSPPTYDGFLTRELGRALDSLGSDAAKAAWKKRP